MKKTRFLSLALTGTLCVSLLAGCGGSGDGGGAAQTPDAANTSAVQENTGSAFKLGGTGPLTGDAAIYGLAAQRGAQIAVDEIKEAGGDIQFALKYEDDVNVPETAVNAYNALKEWGMQISLGSVTSQPGVSTSALAFEDRIFTMTPSGSSPDVISGKDNVYQMCFSDPNQGLASAQYIADKNLGEKVFIIWKNDDVYSTGIKEQFVKEAETLGLEVVGDATFTTDTATDFSVQLTQAQQAGADLLFLPIYYTPASMILTQANAMGYAPTFFGVDGMDGILTLEGFNTELAEGVMLLTPFNADAEDQQTKDFVAKYQEKYNEIPNQFAADAYDCVYAYYQALTNAKAALSNAYLDGVLSVFFLVMMGVLVVVGIVVVARTFAAGKYGAETTSEEPFVESQWFAPSSLVATALEKKVQREYSAKLHELVRNGQVAA